MSKTSKKAEESKEKEETRQKIKSEFAGDNVLTEVSDAARELYNQSRYGALLDNGKVQLSLIEALYLMEKGTIEIYRSKTKRFDSESFKKRLKNWNLTFGSGIVFLRI